MCGEKALRRWTLALAFASLAGIAGGALTVTPPSGAAVGADGTVTVVCRAGERQTLAFAVGNAGASPCSAWVTMTETGRQTERSVSAPLRTALKAKEPVQTPVVLKEGTAFRSDRLMVRFAGEPSAIEGTTVEWRSRLVPGLVRLRLAEPQPTAAAMTAFAQSVAAREGVLYAQPLLRDEGARAPNDPEFGRQWDLLNEGQPLVDWMARSSAGRPGADMGLTRAWNRTVGSPDVIVALIDSGVNYNHPDLAPNMWRNPGEIPGNGIDDDGNGYVDDVYGIDIENDDCDPMDDHGHGTHCAGTIAAAGGNGIDVAGVCWNVKIMALKYQDASNTGWGGAEECFEYAVAHGARIISCSWSGTEYRQAYYDVIRVAGERGVLVVCAAGNYQSDLDTHPRYPACYDLDNIVTVLATDKRDNLARQFAKSNWGLESVDVGAPGEGILSLDWRGGTQLMDGTSMATPHVSGLAALLVSANRALTAKDLKRIIMETGDPVLPGLCASGRRVNAARALDALGLWLSADAVRVDSLAAGATRQVAVTFDATELAAGTYEGVVRCDEVEGGDAVVRPVRLVVQGADLTVAPAGSVAVSGASGGPFACTTPMLTLGNATAKAIRWSVECAADWLVPYPSSGTLASCTETRVALELDEDALAGLAPGGYETQLTIADETGDVVQTRTVRLDVCKGASGGVGYVDAARSDDSGDGRSWATAKRSIDAMAAALGDDATIWVADGVYAPIDVRRCCGLDIRSVNGAGKTVIDGGGVVPCAILKSFLDVTNSLSGFTVRNGAAGAGAGKVDNAEVAGGVTGGRLVNCIVRDCRAEKGPGGISAPLLAVNCLVVGNAGTTGGGVYGPGTVVNATVVRNASTDNAAGVCNYVTLQNAIVWGNERRGAADDCDTGGTLDHCLVGGDPKFVDAAADDWRLQADSPAVDAGAPSEFLPETDLAGRARVCGTAVDCGAYERSDEPEPPPPEYVRTVSTDTTEKNLVFEGTAGRLVLDNATLTVSGILETYVAYRFGENATGALTLEFSGANAGLVHSTAVSSGFIGSTTATSDMLVKFTVPATPWTVAPLRASETDSKIRFQQNVRFEVDATAVANPGPGETIRVPLASGTAIDDDGVTPVGVLFDGVDFETVKQRSALTCGDGVTGELVYEGSALVLVLTGSGDVPKATYYLVGADAAGASSFAKSSSADVGWAETEGGTVLPSHTVSSDNDYVVPTGSILRTPAGTSPVTFAGGSLTLNFSILWKGSKTVTIPDLRVDAGTIQAGDKNLSATLAGQTTIPEGKTLHLKMFRDDNSTGATWTLNTRIVGAGSIRVAGDSTTGATPTGNQTLVIADAADFTGNLYAQDQANPQNFVLKVTGGFGGTVTSLPKGTEKVVFNHDGLDAAKGVVVADAATAVPEGLTTGLVLYSSTVDFTAANLPLITFPSGVTVDPAAFTVKYAASVDGAATAFENMGLIANADGTQTLVANAAAEEPKLRPGEGEGDGKTEIEVTAEGEDEAVAKVAIVSPDESIVSSEVYALYFTKSAVSVAGELNRWVVSAELDEAIVDPEPVATDLAGKFGLVEGGAVDVAGAKPGLWYGVKEGDDLGKELVEGPRVQAAADGTVALKVTKFPTSGFYRVVVGATGKVE